MTIGDSLKRMPNHLAKEKKINMIKCCPCNSKAQGKVERSHRVIRREIYYDLIKQKKTGVNWVKCLSKYMKCLNQEKKRS